MLIELVAYIVLIGIFMGMIVPTVFDIQKEGMRDVERIIYEYKK